MVIVVRALGIVLLVMSGLGCVPEPLTTPMSQPPPGADMPSHGSDTPTDLPNPDAVTFAQLAPIIATQCGTLGCHGAPSLVNPSIEGGVEATPAQVQASLEDVMGVDGTPLIVPGDASASLLWLRISGAKPPVMPPTGAFDAQQLALFEAWIEGGAPFEEAP